MVHDISKRATSGEGWQHAQWQGYLGIFAALVLLLLAASRHRGLACLLLVHDELGIALLPVPLESCEVRRL